VDSYGTEEDQIRAIRQWWERNGPSTLIGVGLALAIVFGSQWWQERQRSTTEQASMLYQQLLQATEQSTADKVQQTTAEHLARELRDSQAGTRYGDYASLLLARLQVDKNEPAAAAAELQALLERQPDAAVGALRAWFNGLLGRHLDSQLGALARVRLARVLFAMGRSDEALAALDAAGTEDFALEKLELRGDILRANGDTGGARKAYAQALEIASGSASMGGTRLLELKQQELDLPGQSTPQATQAAEETP
jgi:predicted negative regulator of RcsB-dependent stress response